MASGPIINGDPLDISEDDNVSEMEGLLDDRRNPPLSASPQKAISKRSSGGVTTIKDKRKGQQGGKSAVKVIPPRGPSAAAVAAVDVNSIPAFENMAPSTQQAAILAAALEGGGEGGQQLGGQAVQPEVEENPFGPFANGGNIPGGILTDAETGAQNIVPPTDEAAVSGRGPSPSLVQPFQASGDSGRAPAGTFSGGSDPFQGAAPQPSGATSASGLGSGAGQGQGQGQGAQGQKYKSPLVRLFHHSFNPTEPATIYSDKAASRKMYGLVAGNSLFSVKIQQALLLTSMGTFGVEMARVGQQVPAVIRTEGAAALTSSRKPTISPVEGVFSAYASAWFPVVFPEGEGTAELGRISMTCFAIKGIRYFQLQAIHDPQQPTLGRIAFFVDNRLNDVRHMLALQNLLKYSFSYAAKTASGDCCRYYFISLQTSARSINGLSYTAALFSAIFMLPQIAIITGDMSEGDAVNPVAYMDLKLGLAKHLSLTAIGPPSVGQPEAVARLDVKLPPYVVIHDGVGMIGAITLLYRQGMSLLGLTAINGLALVDLGTKVLSKLPLTPLSSTDEAALVSASVGIVPENRAQAQALGSLGPVLPLLPPELRQPVARSMVDAANQKVQVQQAQAAITITSAYGKLRYLQGRLEEISAPGHPKIPQDVPASRLFFYINQEPSKLHNPAGSAAEKVFETAFVVTRAVGDDAEREPLIATAKVILKRAVQLLEIGFGGGTNVPLLLATYVQKRQSTFTVNDLQFASELLGFDAIQREFVYQRAGGDLRKVAPFGDRLSAASAPKRKPESSSEKEQRFRSQFEQRREEAAEPKRVRNAFDQPAAKGDGSAQSLNTAVASSTSAWQAFNQRRNEASNP